MKALTVSQPYASLIARGAKFVENRNWATGYRGALAIHAGKGSRYLSREELARYPTGAVVVVARLRACLLLADLRDAWANGQLNESLRRDGIGPDFCRKILQHEHTEGPWCWVLSDVRPIEPIVATGKQGLWEWDAPAVVFKPFDFAGKGTS